MCSNTFNKSISINVLGILFGLVYCLTIALWEELLCRGIILTSFLKKWYGEDKGVIKAIFISALIFGCAHFITAINADLLASIIQVGYTTVMGMLMGAIYIKTRSLCSVILLHFILNIPAYILLFIMPLAEGIYGYNFIQLIVLFSVIWIFLTYILIQIISKDDLKEFIQ